MIDNKGKELITELLFDPILFQEQGKGYGLYNQYSKNGLEIETLIPLLNSNNEDVIKLAIWIASEIAVHACDLFPYVVKHVDNNNPYIRYHSLVFIILCSTESHKEAFIHLVQSISDENLAIGMLGMRLLSNADSKQLQIAIELVERYNFVNSELHKIGLLSLLDFKEIAVSSIVSMLRDHRGLIQQYGAMVIKRKEESNTILINEALECNNAVVREFALALQDL
jgi:hypothetical protein